jgi:plasmid stabilization system protein ParE
VLVSFRPEAQADALEAQAWYEQRSPGLGFEFARALETAVDSAARSPESFKAVPFNCRRVLLRRFPYVLIYRAVEEHLLVIAVFHHRRAPQAWQARTQKTP